MVARTVRTPPRPPYDTAPTGTCRMCGMTPLPGRCRTWCRECPALWHIATSSESAHRHLVAIHGHACWGCGATWEPGVTQDYNLLGHVIGGHPITTLPNPDPAMSPRDAHRDRVPAPDGWITPAYCTWPGPDHGPPAPERVPLEVEHVRPLWSLTDDERDDLRWWLPGNLQLLCVPCHRAKTRREAGERARIARGEPDPHVEPPLPLFA